MYYSIETRNPTAFPYHKIPAHIACGTKNPTGGFMDIDLSELTHSLVLTFVNKGQMGFGIELEYHPGEMSTFVFHLEHIYTASDLGVLYELLSIVQQSTGTNVITLDGTQERLTFDTLPKHFDELLSLRINAFEEMKNVLKNSDGPKEAISVIQLYAATTLFTITLHDVQTFLQSDGNFDGFINDVQQPFGSQYIQATLMEKKYSVTPYSDLLTVDSERGATILAIVPIPTETKLLIPTIPMIRPQRRDEFPNVAWRVLIEDSKEGVEIPYHEFIGYFDIESYPMSSLGVHRVEFAKGEIAAKLELPPSE